MLKQQCMWCLNGSGLREHITDVQACAENDTQNYPYTFRSIEYIKISVIIKVIIEIICNKLSLGINYTVFLVLSTRQCRNCPTLTTQPGRALMQAFFFKASPIFNECFLLKVLLIIKTVFFAIKYLIMQVILIHYVIRVKL